MLDISQDSAIKWNGSSLLVIAGPGSGKTYVIINRISYLLQRGYDPDRILVISYTRDAAESVCRRFRESDKTGSNVHFGTFHSVFFRVLRESFGYDIRSILNENEKKNMARFALKLAGFHTDDRMLSDFFSVLSKRNDSGDKCQDKSKKYAEAEDIYIKMKSERKRLDFDDILFLSHEKLLQDPEILSYWKNRFDVIIIDEAQDMNPIQFRLLLLIKGKKTDIFMVGDDDQSIYGFRGSDPGILKKFTEACPETGIIYLSNNYRCASSILDHSKRLISHNKIRFQKQQTAVSSERGMISVKSFADRAEEAGYITKEIISRINKPTKIGILFRHRISSAFIESDLTAAGISYSYRNRGSIYNIFIVDDIISYLKIMSGSGRRSDYLRIINRPERFISRDSFREEVVSESRCLLDTGNMRARENLRLFFQNLSFASTLPPFAQISYFRRGLMYDDFVKSREESDGRQEGDYMQYLDLINEESSHFKKTETFIEFLNEMNNKEENRYREDPDETVSLMTFHGSKGLEFDTVFILDAVEGSSPSYKAVKDAEMEEERRMFYVAVTRARKELVICTIENDRNKRAYPSRFLREMTEDICQRES